MAIAAPPSARPGSRDRLPAPARDRRPALAALALLLVLGGALTSALLAYRSGDRIDVLVAAHDLPVGHQVVSADLRVARVAADGAAYVPSSAEGNFLGTRTRTEVPSGTLVNRTMFLAGAVVPSGASVVGVTLSPTQRPAGGLRTGDVVQVFAVARDRADSGLGVELLSAVRVVEVTGGTSTTGVSLLVPADRGAAVVAAAAAGSVAVVRLAPDTAPLVELAR